MRAGQRRTVFCLELHYHFVRFPIMMLMVMHCAVFYSLSFPPLVMAKRNRILN